MRLRGLFDAIKHQIICWIAAMAENAIQFSAFSILRPDLTLPFKVGDVRKFHCEEWISVYRYLRLSHSSFLGFYFALSRPIDALALNLRYSKKLSEAKHQGVRNRFLGGHMAT